MVNSSSTDKLAVLTYFLKELPKDLIKELTIDWTKIVGEDDYDYEIVPILKVTMKDGTSKIMKAPNGDK